MTTTTQVGARSGRFLYDAAERRAREAGIAVVSICHASIPKGVPSRDHFGNYVMAETVYIGRPGDKEKYCAYSCCVHSIHQRVEPSVADCLAGIAEALLYVNTFENRESYLDYYYFSLPGAARPYRIDDVINVWHDHVAVAMRARRYLPADVLAWLESGDCYA